MTARPGALWARTICRIRGHRPVKADGLLFEREPGHWQPIWFCATCGRETRQGDNQ